MKSYPHHPLWKHMIIRKKSSHPTISLVFAEAQQVSPSQTAAEKLPQILRKASPSPSSLMSKAQFEEYLDETPSTPNQPELANAHEAGEEPTTGAQESLQSVAEGSLPASPSKSDTMGVLPGAPATSLDFTVPIPSNPSSFTPPRDSSVAALPHKSSWFASWTRTKGEEVPDSGVQKTRRPTPAPASVHLQTHAASSLSSQLPILSITRDSQPVTESTPTSTLPQDIPAKPRSNDPPTSSPRSTSYTSSSSPAAHQSQPSPMSTPSPLDEPTKLPPATPSAVLQSDGSSNSIPRPTNRFTLGIPLLGRVKLPLEKTVAAAQRDDIRTMSLPADQPPPCKQQLTTQESIPLATERPSAPVAEATEVNITADTVVQPGEVADKNAASAVEIASLQTSTWWSYLGWASTQPSESHIESEPTLSTLINPSAIPDAPPPPVGEIVAQPTVVSETVDPQKSADGPDQIASQKAPSVLFAGTSESQGSAWYAPWSWYQGSSTSMGSHSDTQVTGGDGNVLLEPTKDDEILQQSATTVSPSPEPQAPTSGTSETNPISSTITNNRSGWISFFSARAVAMKTITNESRNEEMEVMDLDEDEVPATAGSPSSASSSAPLGKDLTTKQPSPIQAGIPLVSPSSSPAQKKGEEKSIPAGSSVNTADAVRRGTTKRPPSPTPSKKSGAKTPIFPPLPNLVLPTWEDTFHTQPRAQVPSQPSSALSKTFQYVSDVLFARDEPVASKKGKGRERPLGPYEKALPRSWDVIGGQEQQNVFQGCQRAVVIGVHGWFPGAVMRTVIGEPTGTSSKFVNMAVQALEELQDMHNVKLSKITKIPLEGQGTINGRVDKLYQNLIGNQEWMNDLRDADVIFFATHSQGSIVSTHILDRLIGDGHIRTTARDLGSAAVAIASGSVSTMRPPQRVCCLALCGIHHGPLRYLSTSSLVQPYIQYFESIAARELFEFQNTESQLSKDYVKALQNVLDNGVKMVYIASLNDQVVGLYSGLFTSATHPLILRALYIDGDAYHSSDFLSNLLVLLLRIRNAGLSDAGLLAHLSESTAGSLNGVGHSTAYEEIATYSFAINYLFLSDSGQQQSPVELVMEPFDARTERNDYEIPWALRDLIADDRVAELFSEDFIRLRDAFRDWQPKTAILRDVKRKLQPIQRLSSTMISKHVDSMSKL
ncbi:hypothetical protein AZE42_08662 [Rhizopogon vesiculosus]|uniref:YMC020W-like alpha/beta hydrolase domain-containing protein n=1 Tax=Rhizopogon vesiculosus TaxID=180088 RepID=A0A1J8QLX2_9AGAM|nr:hypothetical protein AZE42_08662 [Rhizopogon vesiculosus]